MAMLRRSDGWPGGFVGKRHARRLAPLELPSTFPRSIRRRDPVSGTADEPAALRGANRNIAHRRMIMRNDFDFAPYYRATVGFDRVFDLLDSVANQTAGGYPPYNIERAGEDAYKIVMAVAGFAEAELNVTQKENELLVAGQAAPNGQDDTQYLYRGIAGRNFERRFQLADHVKVVGAKLANGLLTIELQREIPEEKKPRAIHIQAEASPRTITQR
jgi:molecular chaperone IbpA